MMMMMMKEHIIGPLKSNMAEIRHLGKGHDVIFVPLMKFGRPVQNDMPTAVIWSKSKPEMELQYGGRLFFETRNSYISAVD